MQKGVKTFTTVRAAVISIVLCLILLLGLSVKSALPSYSVASMALLVMPTFLLIAGFTAGLIPSFICLVIALALLLIYGGPTLLGFGALYLVPMFVAFVYCLQREKPFWHSCGWVLGAMAGSTVAVYAILQAMTGGNLYAQAANAVATALSGADGILYTFCQAGLIAVPETMAETALVPLENGTFVFADDVRRELLLQVRSIVMQLLQGSLPSLLVSGSVLNVLSGLGFGIHYGRRAAQRRAYKNGGEIEDAVFIDLGMPPLHQWYIPSPWGARIGILAVGYIIMQVSGNETLFLLGALMWQTFFVCYAIQGLAVMNDMQRKRGTGKFWRNAIVVAAFTLSFVQTALMILGVFDQISNARGLRPQKLPRNEEE